MRQRGRGSADIDITPLIDVLFMLIIFFVLTTSFVQGKVDVDLPSGRGATSDSQHAAILTVAEGGSLYWEGRAVTRGEVKKLAAEWKNDVLVAGDENVPYGDVASILAMLRREGIARAGLLLSGEEVK